MIGKNVPAAPRADDDGASRADMHCHSSASEVSRLGVQRAAGLPECATPPEEVYELAKRRGMDFVTITDHDTIEGVLQIADRPDVFISEELTAWFRGEPQAVHVLCYGITPEDHDWLARHRGDLEDCAAYMHEREITCALAHPYYSVAAPLRPAHRRRLAELFPIWEVRNGSRARELNQPAATYAATRETTGIGGSDDHAGVDIGRTCTQTPHAASPDAFLRHIRAGRARARGEQGSAAKWAHAAIALAARSLRDPGDSGASPDPMVVFAMVQRLLREADAREGAGGGELTPADAHRLLRAWLSAVELDHLDERGLLEYMQRDGFSHADLYRRARSIHERRLGAAVGAAVAAAGDGSGLERAAAGLFAASTAAIPYAPATAFLAAERQKLEALPHQDHQQQPGRGRREPGERPRVAIIADGIGSTHGVSRTIEEIRSRGVDGFDIEVVGTDAAVDRRLSAVAEFDLPHYPGLRIGVPSLLAAVETVADGAFDLVHVCSPGPAGIVGAVLARTLGLPLVGSHHTELTTYAGMRSGDERLTAAMALAVAQLYGSCELVLSPSPASDAALAALGLPADRVLRWDRGVDTARFDPSLRDRLELPGEVNVLYSGRLTREKGIDLLLDSFLLARRSDPRLHLVIAGGGPEEERVRERVGAHATMLGWLAGAELAAAYASADVFVFPSSTDTFGQVILEAQASGLPVLAVGRGGPLSLIEHRRTGLLCEPEPEELAGGLLELAGSALLRERVALAALRSARTRTWEAALSRLGAGYARALAGTPAGADGTGVDESGDRAA